MAKSNQPLVSVIVPVYRAERWINQCVDSLLGQTYRNIEMILVDDGSPDRSGVICDDYAARDSRVKVIHQPNGGVSVARQTGIDHAKGEYSIHADPDDWVESTMIEELVAKAIEDDADMVICDFKGETDFGSEYYSMNLPLCPTTDDLLRRLLFQQLHGSCCNKLVRRACYNGVDFPDDVTLLEDELFNIRVLRSGKVKRVAYLPKAFYHYRMNNASSIIHVKNDRNIQSQFRVLEYLLEMFGGDSSFDEGFADRKVHILYDLFLSKRFEQLYESFPEVHQRVIDDQRRWHLYRPVQSGISMALRGYPRLGYFLCTLDEGIFDMKKRIKMRLQRILGKKN